MRFTLLVLLIATASAATAQVNTERMRRLLTDDAVIASVDAAASFATGNTDFLQVGLGGRLDVRVGENTAFLVGRFDLAQTDERAFVDQSFAHLRHNRMLAPRLIAESFVQIQRNRQEALDRRTLLGAGLRYEIVQRDSLGLAFGATPMFEYEVLDEALGGSQDAVGRVSSYVAGRATLPNGTAFTLVSYIQPRVSDPGDLRVLTQASLDVGLTRYLKLRVRTDLRYDSRPPEGIETVDLRLENGVVILIPGR